MQVWHPETDFDHQLLAAVTGDDLGSALALLRGAELALPIAPAAAAGDVPPAWPTVSAADRTWLTAFTSIAALVAGTAGAARDARVVTLPELAAGWPDTSWGLAVDIGLPTQLLLESGTVARLAAPALAVEYAEQPLPPVLQVVVSATGVAELLMHAGRPATVSGYVHLAAEVEHIATPVVLLRALGRDPAEPGLLDPGGGVTLLRWPAVGLELYRSPYGGESDAARAAVHGWVVEEAPFPGLGFGPAVDEVIREFRVAGLALPHGAELWELGQDGVEQRRAVYDGDRDGWLLVTRNPPATDPAAPDRALGDRPTGERGTAEPAGHRIGHRPAAGALTTGYRARFQGVEHPASPQWTSDGLLVRLRSDRPEDGFDPVVEGLWVRAVPVTDCAALLHVTVVGEWRGAPCLVVEERSDDVLVEYTGGRSPEARRLGLERIARGVWRAWVPRAEVRGLRPNTDLLT